MKKLLLFTLLALGAGQAMAASLEPVPSQTILQLRQNLEEATQQIYNTSLSPEQRSYYKSIAQMISKELSARGVQVYPVMPLNPGS